MALEIKNGLILSPLYSMQLQPTNVFTTINLFFTFLIQHLSKLCLLRQLHQFVWHGILVWFSSKYTCQLPSLHLRTLSCQLLSKFLAIFNYIAKFITMYTKIHPQFIFEDEEEDNEVAFMELKYNYLQLLYQGGLSTTYIFKWTWHWSHFHPYCFSIFMKIWIILEFEGLTITQSHYWYKNIQVEIQWIVIKYKVCNWYQVCTSFNIFMHQLRYFFLFSRLGYLLSLDFLNLPPIIKRHKYLLVMIKHFSKWISSWHYLTSSTKIWLMPFLIK